MGKAILYNKRRPLLELEMENQQVTKVYRVLDELRLPIILQDNLSLKPVNEWITKRLIPEKRDGLARMKHRFPGFDHYKNMFSLSDQYWFQYDESETWDELNFFTNGYAEDFGKMFFSPWEVDEEKLSLPSPDRTTNGVLRKRWTQGEDGISSLIKAGSKVFHQDPLSEVLASITLGQLKLLPFVRYDLAVDGLCLCSKCKNFITEDTEFVPASYIYAKQPRKKEENVYQHLLKMCRVYGIIGAREYLNRMITADRIIGNDDRHLGNFGFLRSAETGKILGFAPLFDSGSAYWTKKSSAKKQRLFSEQEKIALKESMHKMNLKEVYDHSEMFRLIDMYPDISKKKGQEIKQSIVESEQELEKCRLEIERESETLSVNERSQQSRDSFSMEK